MAKMKKWFYSEFIEGQSKSDWAFLIVGLAVQIAAIVYSYMNPNGMSASQLFWTAVSGITGIVSVVLCAQRKISFYVFGFIQLFTYVFAVAVPNHLWGEVGENVYYFVTMLVGIVIWFKSYGVIKNEGAKVKSEEFDKIKWIISIAAFVIGTVVLALVLKQTNDPLPWFDSVTTVAPFIAQVLLMFKYREQWIFWAIEDVFSLIMFIVLWNPIMAVQYLFWTINTVYGWFKWKKEEA